ncbi:MAG: hypothetical protein ACLP05_14225 [Candidatus Kryptoniota bacterium]
MANRSSLTALFLVSLIFTTRAISQQPVGYDPHAVFDPNFDNNGGSVYRSANGAPGPEYWQNRADYKIAATLDTTTKSIKGNVEITYTNQSPNELSYVWLQLEQNQLAENSRGIIVAGNPARIFFGGDSIRSVMLENSGKISKADYTISDTRMQIRLPVAIRPKGGKIKIIIEYSFEIPPS